MDDTHRYDRRTVLKGTLAAGGAALCGALPADAAAGGPQERPARAPRRYRTSGLRGRGISYDTGFVNAGTTTHEPFDPEVVKREMRLIRKELNCNAVRVWGGVQERLKIASNHAAHAGLEVWYGPFTTDLTAEEMLDFLAEAADHCERLRRRGTKVVLLLGAELSLLQKGFLPGETFQDRLANLTPTNPQLPVLLAELPGKMNAFFAQAVPLVRARFDGPIGYASIPSLERIDWTPFDYVGADFYPGKVDGEYVGGVAGIHGLQSHGKPVAITEMGCPAYDGAAANPGRASDAIVDWDHPDGPTIIGSPVRDEAEQADYDTGLLELLDAEGVDSAFVYTLASRHFRGPLDVASLGIVRVLPLGEEGTTYPHVPWEPKRAFFDVAELYGKCRGRR
jgi:hypothetical protein